MPYGLNFRFPPSFRGAGGLTLTEQVQALFANGEQGVLYYLTEDFAGLYQGANGLAPVTAVGQPVGLMLDRRFGLARGPELGTVNVSLADFTTTAEVTAEDLGDRIRFTRTGVAYASVNQVIFNSEPVVTSKTYDASFTVLATGASNSVRTSALNGGGTAFVPPNYATGHTLRRAITVATGAGNGRIMFTFSVSRGANPSTAVEGDWFEIAKTLSVRELPGNHASQATATARPTLRSGPLRIDYDGVDDYLRTVFPALGSNVAIARSIPGVGAQILTGQTIAAGNWDDNVDSCATLVIDRALTGPETALVTAFLNQQAGV